MQGRAATRQGVDSQYSVILEAGEIVGSIWGSVISLSEKKDGG